MPSFEIPADIFTRLSVFDSPKGSSNTFKTRKKYQPVLQKKAPNNKHLLVFLAPDIVLVRWRKILGEASAESNTFLQLTNKYDIR